MTARNVAIAFAALVLAGCSSSRGEASRRGGNGGDGGDPAALLANRDGSTDVAAYSAALDAWDAKCVEGRVQSAGIVDATFKDEYRNGGSDPDRLSTMRHLTRSVPTSVAPTNCASIAAAYLVLVEPG